MRHSAKLHAQVKTSRAHVLTEGKAWATGHLLWDQARRSGEVMALIFSAAEDDAGLIYWATIDDITIGEDDRTTICTYSNLKPITPARTQSSLRLRSTGRPLSEDFIRPYAICHTPAFLAWAAPPPGWEPPLKNIGHRSAVKQDHVLLPAPSPLPLSDLVICMLVLPLSSSLLSGQGLHTYPSR
jgi:hypothetical protein